MTKNVAYGLKIIRDFKCFRVGNAAMVAQTGRVAAQDVRPMLQAGWVRADPADGRVTITLEGLLHIRGDLNYRTRKKAEDFFREHDSFYLLEDRLYATGGGYLSRYVAEFFIENGTLVQTPDGRYAKASISIEVGPGEVAAVREFLRCLRLT